MVTIGPKPPTEERAFEIGSNTIETTQHVPPRIKGSWFARLTTVVVVCAILAGAVWGATRMLGEQSKGKPSSTLTAKVERGELLVTVAEDGNLESAVNIDVKCDVAGGSSILWIVEDGTEVKKGEKIVELDSSTLEESINEQRITFEKARAAKIQAEKDYAAAKLAVDEYLQGTFVQAVQDQDAQIIIAEENHRSAQNSLEHSERMFRKGYISVLDLESQRFSVQHAQLELDSARTAKDVLVKFTKQKMLQELESARDSSEAQMRSEGASFDLEQLRLKRLKDQLEECVITAPESGMVVFANDQSSHWGGSQTPQIEEGATVRERQTILRLPDLAQMQVKVNVHESKIDMLGRAMKRAYSEGKQVRALIRILDREEQGAVSNVANQPEPSSWYTGNIKEYATIISIDGTPDGLRPGMTAECEILVDHLENVLMIPAAAVVERRDGYCAWIKQGDEFERRPLVLGLTNDQFVEVQDGLVEGMEVVVNPRAKIPDARDLMDAVEEVDVAEKFGKERKRAPVAEAEEGLSPGGPSQAGPAGDVGKRSGNGGGQRPQMSLSSFDKDGDGKVSKDEVPSMMQDYFGMMDSNGDGFIDSAEMKKLQQMVRNRTGGGGPGGPPR